VLDGEEVPGLSVRANGSVGAGEAEFDVGLCAGVGVEFTGESVRSTTGACGAQISPARFGSHFSRMGEVLEGMEVGLGDGSVGALVDGLMTSPRFGLGGGRWGTFFAGNSNLRCLALTAGVSPPGSLISNRAIASW
jgi:hypothetical protein